MVQRSIGFIGGGRVARIFLEGWSRANRMPSQIVCSDPSTDSRDRLKARFPGIVVTSDNGIAAAQDIVFVAVHPPVLAETVSALKSSLKPDAIIVSLAPKFTFARLSELFGGFRRLARVIPNAPSVIGAGFNPVAFAPELSVADRAEIARALAPLGESPEVAEQKLEAYAVLAAMGPTYFWFQLQALREIAGGFGLTEAEVAPALQRMVCGGTRTLLESGMTPAEVMDLVPVKPLAEMEAQVGELYRTRLPAIYQKIKP